MNIQRLISGGIITTYACPSRCRHCLYNCGPGRSNGYLSGEDAAPVFRKVRRMGCRAVHIGGGEPMLNPDALRRVLSAASEEGVSIDYVETNSAWFRDMESAADILGGLRRSGLKTLLVSISPFHNEFIPFKKTQGVIRACEKAGVQVFPWVSGFLDDLSAFDPSVPHSREEYAEKFGDAYWANIPQRYWIHFGGRAAETYRRIYGVKPADQIIDENPGGCAGMLSDTSHFHIDLYGNYTPGLCSGVSIDYRDLGDPLDREKYPVLHILFESGVKGLARYVHGKGVVFPENRGYLNKCDLCAQLRGRLVHQHICGRNELHPRLFYDAGSH